MDNKEFIRKLKDSIEYRSKHKVLIDQFKDSIINYFYNKYDVYVRVLFFGDTWGIEQDYGHYYHMGGRVDFDFSIDVLADFCREFECDFLYTRSTDRYIFTFKDVDMSHAFCNL